MYFNKVDINRIEQHFFRESGENEIYMVLLAEEDMFFATALVDLFNMHQAVFMGGVFPYLISQGDLKEQGVIINRLPGGGKCFFLEGPEPSMEEVAPWWIISMSSDLRRHLYLLTGCRRIIPALFLLYTAIWAPACVILAPAPERWTMCRNLWFFVLMG